MALLRTIPGVGARTAEAVVAFVDDPHRFKNAKAIGRYFGLVPCQDQSGDRNRLGHITREGPPVVHQLVAEAAWEAIRRSPRVRAFFERAQREDPQRQKIALVATAHDLVRVMWAMMRHGTTWHEGRGQGGVARPKLPGTASATEARPTPPRDRERNPGCIPRSDMAHHDAAGVNGSNRVLPHGAPRPRVMPNGCLGSPAIVLLRS